MGEKKRLKKKRRKEKKNGRGMEEGDLCCVGEEEGRGGMLGDRERNGRHWEGLGIRLVGQERGK